MQLRAAATALHPALLQRWRFEIDGKVERAIREPALGRRKFLFTGAGRWLSRDPAGEAASLNLYAYAIGDPLNRIDPSGLYDFRSAETQDILDHAIEEYNSQNKACALGEALENNSANGRATGKYDFRFKNAEDTFSVSGLGQLSPSEFGNYFAGYVNYTAFGDFGVGATRVGGSFMETYEHKTFRDDPLDIDIISRGAYDAGSGSGPRYSPCQCGAN